MTNELIEKFVETKKREDRYVNIHFKQRDTLSGLFIREKDYEELKSKNFWRIVSASKMEEWKKTKNQDLARLYNGAEFTRLSD